MEITATKAAWPIFARRLSAQGLGISGKYYPVKKIFDAEQQIGYTSPDPKVIYLAPFWHPILDEFHLDDDVKKVMFIRGIHLHELMHQLETDFDELEKVRNEISSPAEQKIFHMIANIVEDPAIEYRAQFYCDGDVLHALRFAIATTYKWSPEADPKAKPFDQLVHALIEYGDGGILKSEIASDEAKDMFLKIIPTVDAAIVEPSGQKRVAYFKQIFEMTRPLWEEIVRDYAKMAALEELLKKLGKKLMEGLKGKPSGSSSGESGSSISVSGYSPLMSRRKATKKSLMESGIGGGGDPSESDPSDSEDGSETGKPSYSKGNPSDDSSTEENTSSSVRSFEIEMDDEDIFDDDDNSEDSFEMSADMFGEGEDSGDSKDSKESEEKSDTPSDHDSGDSSDDADPAPDINEDLTLSEEEISSIEKEIKKCEEEGEKEEREEEKSDEVIDIPEVAKKYPRRISTRNIVVNASADPRLDEMYDNIVNSYEGMITNLVSQMNRMFKNDASEKAHRASGKIDVNRLRSGKLTARVFTKRIDPSNKKDMSVLIVVDNSGSMWGHDKIKKARECTIALSEVFSRLKVPFKVVGFTADTGAEAVHYHYVNWKKSKKERVTLLNMEAMSNNFDGYSIRYCTELLKKRPEQNRLMIVISDGQPACNYYPTMGEGVADTRNAVKEANKYFPTVGIAIDGDIDVLHSIYGSTFVAVKRVSDMFETIGGVIKKEVRRYGE